jgi:glycosyltransferase involved in cell wall biosynthesis
MRILARARVRVSDLTLTVVGTPGRHTGYYHGLRRLASSLGAWIDFEEHVTRERVQTLMAASRYGIHGMREEHFGMAAAEMASAGMIVWVPNGGGQVEIVGEEPMLRYDDEDEAADHIVTVMHAAAEQRRLAEYLRERSRLFAADRFMQRMRQIVSSFNR